MDETRELLGRAAAMEFALGKIIEHLPADARTAVQAELRTFARRADASHASGRATADAASSILKESGAATGTSPD